LEDADASITGRRETQRLVPARKVPLLPGLQASAARPSPRNQQVAELERRNLPFGIAYDDLARLLRSALPAN